MRRTPLLVALLALALLFGACGKPKAPSASTLREKISTELRQTTSSLTKAQADCYANLLVKELGPKAINDINLTDKEPEPKIARKMATAAIAATHDCDLGGAPTTSSTVVADTTTTTAG